MSDLELAEELEAENDKLRGFAKESADKHIQLLNRIQNVYEYERNDKGEYVETSTKGGTFYTYDVWAFLDRSADYILHLTEKGLIKSSV